MTKSIADAIGAKKRHDVGYILAALCLIVAGICGMIFYRSNKGKRKTN